LILNTLCAKAGFFETRYRPLPTYKIYPLFTIKLSIISPTFAARSKKADKQHFLQLNQGNEQLRIDGDFYPCAI